MNDNLEINGNPLLLIADDDPTMRLIMREALEQAGFDVIEACDGEAAIECYESAAPNLVLLDVDMPGLDGFSVCEKIRAMETERKTPICIVTGLDDDESIERAFDVGATDFISKPIAWPILCHRVRYVLRASDTLNEINGLISALPDTIYVLDKDGRSHDHPIGAGNDNRTSTLPAVRASFEDIYPQRDNDQLREYVKRTLATPGPQVLEHTNPEGTVHLETRLVARDEQSVLAIVRDVTERKKSESQIYDLAFFDKLTGLPNRQRFAMEVDCIIRDAHQSNSQFAILFIDLDRFKRINDTLGHSIGDDLLKSVARRLEECTRASDRLLHVDQGGQEGARLARLGGDEFVVILPDVDCDESASSIASRIITSLSRPFSCEGYQFVVTPSIGIAIYPQDGEDHDELLMNADSAMYKAKAAGRNNYQFYSGTMKVRSLFRLDMENELRRAIDEEHFELYYQPKVDLSTWEIVGVEALLRWNHAERGWISPADFVPVAEESGLILSLGTWVLRTACQQLRRWQDSELGRLSVSVNVSPQQMYSDDLGAAVTKALTDSGARADRLELEITEGLLMRDVESTIATLKFLKDLGLTLSIDDFGTGYSSLSYLKRFPIDVLKIDRSFVQDLHRDSDDAAICAAILAMARQLDLRVVAEGVELEEQLTFLQRHKCDQIQGYLFSKPLMVSEFESLALADPVSGMKAVRT